MPTSESPVIMPVLSAGRHKSPRRGACFMEFASWLAGERWSDHPACTHPALASLARLVNDCSTNAGRAGLVELIPSVIGVVDDEPLAGVLVAVRATSTAIPIANYDRQRALGVALLSFERYLSAWDDPVAERARALIRAGLASSPAARRWAEEFSLGQSLPRAKDIARVCAAAMRVSVIGIAEACVENPDAVLRGLLAAAIDDFGVRGRTVGTVATREFADQRLSPVS